MKNEVITYEGEVCNFMGELTNRDPLSGKGKLILNSGKIYEGHFINGKLNKFGKYIDENGNMKYNVTFDLTKYDKTNKLTIHTTYRGANEKIVLELKEDK